MSNWFYSMKDVLGLLQADGYITERIPNSGELRCSCPKCGNGKKISRNFSVNLDSEVFHCFSCDFGGRFSQNLYAELNNIDRASANKEIMSRLGIDTSTAYPKRVRQISEPVASISADAEIAPVEVRDKVYRTTLRTLALTNKHKEDLLNRGLTEREISELGYKTFPGDDVQTVWKILDALKDNKLDPEGCAGFYRTSKQNKWFCKYPKKDMIMVKYMSFDKKLTGFQMRCNDEDLRRFDEESQSYVGLYPEKYMWWSTKSDNHGVKPAGMIHYACEFEKNDKEKWQPKLFEGKSGEKYMCITEGAMKGDIAHMISGKPFICLPGVSIRRDLEKDLPKLKEIGVTTFIICFDIDQLMNINVLRQADTLAKMLTDNGFKVKNGTIWDITYKTVSGNFQKFDLDYDFVFTSKTLQEAIDDEKLESIMDELISYGRINVFFAVSDSFSKEDRKRYSELLKLAKNKQIKSCKYVQYSIKYKGVDDFFAGTQRNVEYV